MIRVESDEEDNELKRYFERLLLFKRYGYDLIHARKFILDKFLMNQNILEIGTGKGHTAIGLAKRKTYFTTIDIDKKSLRIARHNLNELRLLDYVSIRRMDAEHLQFKDNIFDGVISVNFIHHARHPRKCIKEMMRVARNTIVISDLNKRGEAIMDRVHALEGLKHERSRMPLNEMKKFLEKLGSSVKVYRDKCQTVFIAKKGK